MLGAIILAVFAVEAVGGLAAMKEGVSMTVERTRHVPAAIYDGAVTSSTGSWWGDLLAWSATPVAMFLVLITLQWWANKNADGGAVVIQRMAASARRARVGAGDALSPSRQLRAAAAVAVDPRRARESDPLSDDG